jgi:hypothetical protein
MNAPVPIDDKWRCFHCGETFTDSSAAAEHFGAEGFPEAPACKLNQLEGGMLKMLRDAQAELRRYREEDHAAHRTFYALGAEHHTALIREEEKGYERGLRDARALLPRHWNAMDSAPRDGNAFLACGVHTSSPPSAQRGVKAGDTWWAIILWDIWRTPHQFVFAKDGEPLWSAPKGWMRLPEIPI